MASDLLGLSALHRNFCFFSQHLQHPRSEAVEEPDLVLNSGWNWAGSGWIGDQRSRARERAKRARVSGPPDLPTTSSLKYNNLGNDWWSAYSRSLRLLSCAAPYDLASARHPPRTRPSISSQPNQLPGLLQHAALFSRVSGFLAGVSSVDPDSEGEGQSKKNDSAGAGGQITKDSPIHLVEPPSFAEQDSVLRLTVSTKPNKGKTETDRSPNSELRTQQSRTSFFSCRKFLLLRENSHFL